MFDESFPGAVFLCDDSGTILRVYSGKSKELQQGGTFHSLVGEADQPRATQFWSSVTRSEPGASDFLISLDGPARIHSCMAGRTSEGILVVISDNSLKLFELYEELVRINSDQANELRRVLKEMSVLKREGRTRDEAMLTELSQVNNELVNTQRELAKKNRQLTDLNQQKNAFLGMAAHDLRNPLAGILGMSDILHDDLDRPEHRETMGEIRELATRMLSLVEDYLDLTVIEGGRLELKTACIELNDLVQRYMLIHDKQARKKEITLVPDIPDAPLRVTCDPGKVAQILDNLLSNAIKFSPANGTVRVTLVAKQEQVLMRVDDNGPGVPDDKREHIFTMFGTGAARTTGGEPSSGVGLAIVNRIVSAHGGTIAVLDSPLGGARFEVALPLEGCAATFSRNLDHDQKTGDKSAVDLHALIIDDEAVNRKLLCSLLDKHGVTTTMAENGKQGLASLDSGTYSLVFLDLELPDMHGTEIARAIRATPLREKLGPIPVIAVTGHTDPDMHEQCLQSGCTDILTKPLQPRDLERVLKGL
jgi:signal transduction histidine kinase